MQEFKKEDLKPFIDKINEILQRLKEESPNIDNFKFEYDTNASGFPILKNLSKTQITSIKIQELSIQKEKLKTLSNKNNITSEDLNPIIHDIVKLNNIHRDARSTFNILMKGLILLICGKPDYKIRTNSNMELRNLSHTIMFKREEYTQGSREIASLINEKMKRLKIKFGTME